MKEIPTASQALNPQTLEAETTAKPTFLPNERNTTAKQLQQASNIASLQNSYKIKEEKNESLKIFNKFQEDFNEKLYKPNGLLDINKGVGSTKKILGAYEELSKKYANGKSVNIKKHFLELANSSKMPIFKNISNIERNQVQKEEKINNEKWQKNIINHIISNGFESEDIEFYKEQYAIKNKYEENGSIVYPEPSDNEINNFTNQAQETFLQKVKQDYELNPMDASSITNLINTGNKIKDNPELFKLIKKEYKEAQEYQKNSHIINTLVNEYKDDSIAKLKEKIKKKGYNNTIKQGSIQQVERYKQKQENEDNQHYMKLFDQKNGTWLYKDKNDALTATSNVNNQDDKEEIIEALFGKGNPYEMFQIMETRFTVEDLIKSKKFNRDQIAVFSEFAFNPNQSSKDYNKKRLLLDKFLNFTKGEFYEEESFWSWQSKPEEKANARLALLQSVVNKISYRYDEDINVLEREMAFEVMNYNKLMIPVNDEDKREQLSQNINGKMASDISVISNMYNNFSGTKLQMLKTVEVLKNNYTGTNKEFDVYNLKSQGYTSKQILKAFEKLIQNNLKPTKNLIIGEIE
jgi:hypothetical protein